MATFKKRNRFILTILILFTTGFAFFSSFIVFSLQDLSSVRALERYTPPLPTKIIDINGELITEFFIEKRKLIPFNEIPPYLIQATIATEDERFFENYGVNPWRILQALIKNIFAGEIKQGGSTITIQLSKLLFLTPRQTITRKIKELWYTIQIEKQYSKQEILWFYFNQIPYGHGCYGIEAAANFYFNKNAKDLNLAESSLLAGIPNAPAYFSPLRHPKNAMKRHKTVLNHMVRTGYISRSEAITTYQTFWRIFTSKVHSRYKTAGDTKNNQAPYFVEYIRKRLENILGKKKLYKGGFVIHTTLDINKQKAAQKYLGEALERQDRIHKWRIRSIRRSIEEMAEDQLEIFASVFNIPYDIRVSQEKFKRIIMNRLSDYSHKQLLTLSLITGQEKLFEIINAADFEESSDFSKKAEGALISIDPATGYIKAMVGGSGFHYRNQINHVFLAKRQIGSLMKPFVYAAAIDKKIITPATIIEDRPTVFGSSDEGFYSPKNYSGKYHGPVLARDALRKSINVCAVKVLNAAGTKYVREYAGRIFRVFSTNDLYEKFPKDLTMGLGTGSFSPFDMATAFSVFANEGREIIPLSIRFITDSSGDVITNIEKKYLQRRKRQLVDPATAYIMTRILKGVFEPGGTAYRWELLKDFPLSRYSCGKTGTTSNWKDAWFAGYNKYLCTVVWVGYDDNDSLGKGRTGGNTAAPVWIKYNRDVLNSKKISDFEKPNNIVTREICHESGKLKSTACTSTYTEYFIQGTAPNTFCRIHENEEKKKKLFIQKVKKRDKNRAKKIREYLKIMKTAAKENHSKNHKNTKPENIQNQNMTNNNAEPDLTEIYKSKSNIRQNSGVNGNSPADKNPRTGSNTTNDLPDTKRFEKRITNE